MRVILVTTRPLEAAETRASTDEGSHGLSIQLRVVYQECKRSVTREEESGLARRVIGWATLPALHELQGCPEHWNSQLWLLPGSWQHHPNVF